MVFITYEMFFFTITELKIFSTYRQSLDQSQRIRVMNNIMNNGLMSGTNP